MRQHAPFEHCRGDTAASADDAVHRGIQRQALQWLHYFPVAQVRAPRSLSHFPKTCAVLVMSAMQTKL